MSWVMGHFSSWPWWKALFRMEIWGSPPVGWRPGRPRRHSPPHAHPAHIDDEGGHGVEGMCFVRGMLSNASMVVVLILMWFCLLNTKFLVAFCRRLGFRDGRMLRLNLMIARRPGAAANGDGHWRSFQTHCQILKKNNADYPPWN